MSYIRKKYLAFSLYELIISISVIIILFSLTLSKSITIINNFQNNLFLKQTLNFINYAKQQAIFHHDIIIKVMPNNLLLQKNGQTIKLLINNNQKKNYLFKFKNFPNNNQKIIFNNNGLANINNGSLFVFDRYHNKIGLLRLNRLGNIKI